MASIHYKFQLDLDTAAIKASINAQTFPLLNQAARAIAQATANTWKAEVAQAKLWSGEKDKYIQSITWQMTGDFSAVVEATYKHAAEIDSGRPARDLKKMLGTSDKVRRTAKTNKRFLVIPLRHNVAKLESAGLYEQAAALDASSIIGQGVRPAGEVTHLSPKTGMSPAAKQSPFLSSTQSKQAAQVAKNKYGWGGKLSDTGGNKWAKGMVRFDTSTAKAKSSSYMTFRIMMEGQGGWIVPAQPGLQLAKKVTDTIQPKAEQAFAQAIKLTLTKG